MKRRNPAVIDNVYHADFGDEAPGDVPWAENLEVENTRAADALPFFPPTLTDWAAVVRTFAVGVGILGLIGAVWVGLGIAVAVFIL